MAREFKWSNFEAPSIDGILGFGREVEEFSKLQATPQTAGECRACTRKVWELFAGRYRRDAEDFLALVSLRYNFTIQGRTFPYLTLVRLAVPGIDDRKHYKMANDLRAIANRPEEIDKILANSPRSYRDSNNPTGKLNRKLPQGRAKFPKGSL